MDWRRFIRRLGNRSAADLSRSSYGYSEVVREIMGTQMADEKEDRPAVTPSRFSDAVQQDFALQMQRFQRQMMQHMATPQPQRSAMAVPPHNDLLDAISYPMLAQLGQPKPANIGPEASGAIGRLRDILADNLRYDEGMIWEGFSQHFRRIGWEPEGWRANIVTESPEAFVPTPEQFARNGRIILGPLGLQLTQDPAHYAMLVGEHPVYHAALMKADHRSLAAEKRKPGLAGNELPFAEPWAQTGIVAHEVFGVDATWGASTFPRRGCVEACIDHAENIALAHQFGRRQRGCEEWAGCMEPFFLALRGGAWRFVVTRTGVLVLLRPHVSGLSHRTIPAGSFWINDLGVPTRRDATMHREDGPAIWWEKGPKFYYWRGVRVPAQVIEAPRSITKEGFLSEKNVEIRRAMFERMGGERFIEITGAEVFQKDECGELYRIERGKTVGDWNTDRIRARGMSMPFEFLPSWEERDVTAYIVYVKVKNSTPEPDGSAKSYFLRVDPRVKTAREAVAWSFRMSEKEYKPVKQT